MFLKVKQHIIFVLFFGTVSSLTAQDYLTNVRHYNMEMGLETHDFRHAFKDSQGFMWFSSAVGAYRFDGYQFQYFKRKTHKWEHPYAIDELGEDTEKNIWFFHRPSTNGKADISILPFGKNSLVSFDQFFANNLPFPAKKVQKMIFDPSNFIAFICEDGQLFEYAQRSFVKVFQISPTLPSTKFKSHLNQILLTKTPDNFYWLAYKNELLKISPNQKAINKKQLIDNWNEISITTGKEYKWLRKYAFSELRESNNKASQLKDLNFKTQGLNLLPSNSNLNSGHLIASKSNSIYDLVLFDLKNNSEIQIEPFGKPNTNISPRSFFVENVRGTSSGLNEQEETSIWLTTHDGIYHIQLTKNKFNNYLAGTNTRQMIMGENNELWVTSNSGFHRIDLTDGTVQTKTEEIWKYGRGLYWDNANELWMGKLFRTIGKINPAKFEFEKEDVFDQYSGLDHDFNFIHRDKKTQQLWAGTTRNLLRYDEQLDAFIPFKKSNGFSAFDSLSMMHFFENEDLILIATPRGIFHFHPEEGILQHFSTQNQTLPFDNINFIHQDKVDSTFWLATKFGGLVHWDMKSKNSRSFTTQDGLTDNLIYAIYEDDIGHLWLPSNRGLMRLDKKTKEVVTYTTKDGLPYDEFNYFSHHQDEDGNLYLGGLNGITIFHPKNIKESNRTTPLYITGYEVLNDKTGEFEDNSNAISPDGKTLSEPVANSFHLTFALLDFQNPEKNEFAYQIEGLDKNWTLVKDNAIRINSLPHGNYVLKIKAKNAKGKWSGEQLAIPIDVLKPFYLQTWFFITIPILIFLLVWGAFRLRFYNLRKDKEKLESEVHQRTLQIQKDKQIIEQQAEELRELDALKSRFFANVTHELRTPLTLILAPLNRLLKKENLPETDLKTLQLVYQNGQQLQTLVEEILDLSRLEANKLDAENSAVDFPKLIDLIFTNFEGHAQIRNIDFRLQYLMYKPLQLKLDAKKLERILNNLLSNAFKFTAENGQVLLRIKEENSRVKIEVTDTGQGIHPSDLPHIFERFYQSKKTDTAQHGGLGIGLALSKEFSKIMIGELSATSVYGEGTTFTFSFPLEIVPTSQPISEITSVRKEDNIIEKTPIISNKKIKALQKVLIVEDNPGMQHFVQEIIGEQFETILANNGKSALRILGNEKNIDLIISDVMMPEMDGFALLEKIKSEEATRFLPVVMLTARADQSDKLQALSIGVNDYLTKPFEPEELLARVKNLLQNAKLRKKKTNILESKYSPNPEFEKNISADQEWLKELEGQVSFLLEKSVELAGEKLNVFSLAQKMAISERQLHRRLKDLTGLTPGNFIKEIRLKKAQHFLETKTYKTISEVSYAVGFSTPEYFSHQYKIRFGKLPSSYLK